MRSLVTISSARCSSARTSTSALDGYAGFAQASYKLSDRLSLIAGGRLTNDKKFINIATIADFTGADRKFSSFAGVPIFSNATVCGQIAQHGRSARWSAMSTPEFTPRLGLEFKATDNVLLYATWTRGYSRAAGRRAPILGRIYRFRPRDIDSYEVGAKTTLPGGRGTFNLTGFYYDYTNLFNTGTAPNGNFGIAVRDAKIYGIEAEANVQIIDGVRGFANLLMAGQ